ncbi:MAG: peptide deformylase [Eubacteriales bacterium]|nr:peptide deformylase [Eubacteriales bacterium]MDY4434411.1 peptide deformylase [Candidatus Flemingibacterium sp.]
MAKLNIVKDGDPILRKTSRKIETIDDRIKTLAADMLETMHDANGVGLAAVQVGKLRRLVIVEVEEGRPFILINPEIVAKEGRQTEVEGCLSIPGKWGITDRPMKVTVRATGLDGKNFSVMGSGLLARALCHEIDHLDGKLFTDNVIRMLDPDELEN